MAACFSTLFPPSPSCAGQDMKAHGRYRTRDLILGFLARIRSGTLSHESLA